MTSLDRGVAVAVRAIVIVLMLAASASLAAEGRRAPDTYTAVTTNMSPAEQLLKIDILSWSDEAGRGAAIAALESEDPQAALAELPTLGYVWLDGSAVGYAVKYAHRESNQDGSERVTIVTDKILGAYSLNPWSVDDQAMAQPLDYSVIALELDAGGTGSGTFSLAAHVDIDDAAARVSLAAQSAPQLLTAVKREPKPYWAREG